MTDTGIPTVLNPLLSPELRAEVGFFQKWGYLVVENATTTEQVEVLRQAIDLAKRPSHNLSAICWSRMIDFSFYWTIHLFYSVSKLFWVIVFSCTAPLPALLSRVKTIRIGIGTAPGQSTPTVRPMVAYRDRSTVATSWTS